MKKALVKYISLLSVLSVSFGGLVSCGESGSFLSEQKALVEMTTNGHGSISVDGVGTDGRAEVNSLIKVTAEPDDNYYLSSVFADGTDITSSFSFTVSEVKNYIVNATFLPVEGEYMVELSGDRLVEAGKTMQLSTTVYGPDKEVSYFISDPDLATVSSSSLVSTKKPGFVIVTATAAGSNRNSPATASFSFLVAPSYVVKMTDSMKDYSLEKGMKFGGTITVCLSPFSSSDPDSRSMVIPYEFALKKDKTKGVEFDFHIPYTFRECIP